MPGADGRAAEVGVVRWPRRNVMIGVWAAVAAIGLAAATMAVLQPGPGTPVKPAVPEATGQLFSPFTGEPVPSFGPVLAAKIDNLAPARPQTGLTSADIVYVIPVEGGLTCTTAGSAATSVIRAGSRRTTCMRAARSCSPRQPGRAGPVISGTGSGPRRPAGAR